MTDAERDNIVDRYRRGQTLNHIGFALGKCPKDVKAVLVARKVPLRGRGSKGAKPNWGFRGI